jgi:hypothetical protein
MFNGKHWRCLKRLNAQSIILTVYRLIGSFYIYWQKEKNVLPVLSVKKSKKRYTMI